MLTCSVVCGLLDQTAEARDITCPTEDEPDVHRDHVACLRGHIGDQVAAALNSVFSHFTGFSLVRKDGWMDGCIGKRSGVH